MDKIGVYIHVPFCDAKCPYCDFYSICNRNEADRYSDSVCNRLRDFSKKYKRVADTVYFGGGTPTLAGAENIRKMLLAVSEAFGFADGEVTCETNPSRDDAELLSSLRKAGVNRLSVGLQSAVDGELLMLGRRHTAEDAARCVAEARNAGFENVSVDLMLGIPGQTRESLERTLSFIDRLSPDHVSAYILKIEPGTRFFSLQKKGELNIPDDDEASDLYIEAVNGLEQLGLCQYEISNFARKGFESRHNLKYWDDREYLGVGPSAHSFMEGQRFRFDRSIRNFLSDGRPIDDGSGGDFNEYVMLRLRLTDGLCQRDVLSRFGHGIPNGMIRTAKELEKHGFVTVTPERIALTVSGFLVSNEIIARIIYS